MISKMIKVPSQRQLEGKKGVDGQNDNNKQMKNNVTISSPVRILHHAAFDHDKLQDLSKAQCNCLAAVSRRFLLFSILCLW